MTDQDPTQQLEADIAAQRAELADTVDQLAHKLDVKAQAKARLDRIGPQQIALVAAAAVTLIALVWWRRR